MKHEKSENMSDYKQSEVQKSTRAGLVLQLENNSTLNLKIHTNFQLPLTAIKLLEKRERKEGHKSKLKLRFHFKKL